MQKIVLIGNIGRDAEVKQSANNQFVTFTVAVTTKRKNGDNTHEITNWFDCAYDNVKLAEYLKKGTKVYIEGGFKLDTYFSETTQKWIPKINVFVNTIELLSKKQEENGQVQAPSTQQSPVQAFEAAAGDKDDLPF